MEQSSWLAVALVGAVVAALIAVVAGRLRRRHAPSEAAPIASSASMQAKRDANGLMIAGVGIGVLGGVTAAVGSAVCPVCVVAAPALLGAGAYRRWRASRGRDGRAVRQALRSRTRDWR